MKPSTIQAFVDHEQRLAEHLESKISLDASETGLKFMCDTVQASTTTVEQTCAGEKRGDTRFALMDSLIDMNTSAETEPIPLDLECPRGQLTLSSVMLHDPLGSLSAWAMDWVAAPTDQRGMVGADLISKDLPSDNAHAK
jgi:hypothetical protein